MNVLRLKNGEKIAIGPNTTNKINVLMMTGAELIVPSHDIMFWREDFQSITPMMK